MRETVAPPQICVLSNMASLCMLCTLHDLSNKTAALPFPLLLYYLHFYHALAALATSLKLDLFILTFYSLCTFYFFLFIKKILPFI
jgi:hypothetical protein